MPDLGNYNLVAALRESGCPLCRVLAEAEDRWMDAFIRERELAAESLSVFCDRGGFCRSHAWQLHHRSALTMTGAPVAQAYGALLRKDIEHLEKLASDLPVERRSRLGRRSLLGRRTCPACETANSRLHGKADALVSALAESGVREAYRDSNGLCVQHLDVVGAAALARNNEVAAFLIEDLRQRLEVLEDRLNEYERQRDSRYRSARGSANADAWTDVVRSYVGE